METDHEQILGVHQAWLEAERNGDVETMLHFCSGDIRFLPPDQSSIYGKYAVLQFLQTNDSSNYHVEITDLQIQICGNLAYKSADFITTSGSGSEDKIHGHHLWILRKEDFHWRIVMVAWTIDPNSSSAE
jgi:ketosteroid isomerase-like protein